MWKVETRVSQVKPSGLSGLSVRVHALGWYWVTVYQGLLVCREESTTGHLKTVEVGLKTAEERMFPIIMWHTGSRILSR